MAGFNVRIRIRISPALARWGLAAVFLGSFAPELASESVTLSTYFPAPSGIYGSMITSQGTFLGRDGGFVDVGTTAALTGGAALSVMNGNVGIGSTNPRTLLWVQSPGCWSWGQCSGWGDNNIGNGTYGLSMGVATAGGGAGDGRIWSTGGTRRMIFGNPTEGDTLSVMQGLVGIDLISPKTELDVNGVIVPRQTSCGAGAVVAYADGVQLCGANQYATDFAGIVSKYQMVITAAGSGDVAHGEMLCCSCPASGCPNF